MKSEIIKLDNYTINYIKTNNFKNCQIQFVFKEKLKVNTITCNSLLLDFLVYSSYNYPTRRELRNKLEYLYNSNIYGKIFKIGENLFHEYDLYFLNPKYCDKNYMDEVVKLFSEIIFNPNFDNGDYSKKAFEICKNNYRDYLISLKESPAEYAIKRSVEIFGKESLTGITADGYLEELEKLTIDDLKKEYDVLLNNTECYIYIIGNINKKQIVNCVNKYLEGIKINKNNNNLYIHNKERKEVLYLEEKSSVKQDTLVIFYNLELDSKKEKNIDAIVFNYIFGAGGLISKLYDKVREKHSLCYVIYSAINRYDNYLYIYAGINKKDKELCMKLIDECLAEMINGDFTVGDIKDSVKALKNVYRNITNSSESVLNYRLYIDFCENYEIEDRISLLEKVTKEDIINVAKKLRKNMVFLLCGDDENGNN